MLVVEDHGPQPVDLEENCVLGCLQSVERILPEENVQKKRQLVQFAISDWAMPQHFTSARMASILEKVKLCDSQLTSEQRKQLASLVDQYQDSFALEPIDLGTTELVTHSIHTGDHPAIRQPLRRTVCLKRENGQNG